MSDACPTVSTDHRCVPIELTNSGPGSRPVVIPGGAPGDVDDIRSKSGTIQVEVDTKNGVSSINISTLLLLLAMTLIRLN